MCVASTFYHWTIYSEGSYSGRGQSKFKISLVNIVKTLHSIFQNKVKKEGMIYSDMHETLTNP